MIMEQMIVRQRFVFLKIFSTGLGKVSQFFFENRTLEVFNSEIGTAYDHDHTFYQLTRPNFAKRHAKKLLSARKST